MTDDGNRNITDELTAIQAVAAALQPLGNESRRHVIEYVAQALGIGGTATTLPSPTPTRTASEVLTTGAEAVATVDARPLDIRTLKEQKQPRSANEMAALVAYYVSELAPPGEQQAVVTAADIEKYFKQANYRLPSRVAQTLPDAARAGYFDVVDRGQYKLNPVGYNLVAHGMPSGSADGSARPTRSRKPTAVRRGIKKATPKKATAKKVALSKRPARKRT